MPRASRETPVLVADHVCASLEVWRDAKRQPVAERRVVWLSTECVRDWHVSRRNGDLNRGGMDSC